MALHFRVFCRVLLLVLCNNAIMACFVSHSIRRVIVVAVASSLLLQIGYFGSVLFLICQPNSEKQRSAQSAEHCQKVRYQSQEYQEGDE